MFKVVALVELFYGAAGLLIPPSLVQPILGWNLTPDGQWVTKLLGCALLTQALMAWLPPNTWTPPWRKCCSPAAR